MGLSAAEWQIAGRKIWNWGEKNQHIRDDARARATSCSTEPDVAALVPRIRALPAQRVAVIGHSFTMDLHWSSPSAFVPIVTAMFARENPKVEFRQFQGGGLTSTRAYDRFFKDVGGLEAGRRAAGGPEPHGRGPREASRCLGQGLTAAGARVLRLRRRARPGHRGPRAPARRSTRRSAAAGITIVEVGALLVAAPDRDALRRASTAST